MDPLLFYKPYYLEAGKGGDKAYVLLREALVKAGKIAIAKVVIRARQHLAAVKPQKNGRAFRVSSSMYRSSKLRLKNLSEKPRCRWPNNSLRA